MRASLSLLSVVLLLPLFLADDAKTDVKETDDAYIVENADKSLGDADKSAKSAAGQTRLFTNNNAVNGAVVGLGVGVLGSLLVGKLLEKKECPPYRGRRDAQQPQTRFLPGVFGGGKKCPPPPAYPSAGPAYHHPSSGYNTQYNGYNKPNSGYNQPTSGYNRPSSGYQTPSNNYNNNNNNYNVGYNQPSNGYNRPSSGYQQSNAGYNNGYQQQNTGYNRPSNNYNRPSNIYQPNPSSGYRPQNSNYGYQNPTSGYRPNNNYNQPQLSPIYQGRSSPVDEKPKSGPKEFGGAVKFGQTSIVHVL